MKTVNYLLTLRFRGTAYCGWQVQKNAKSVQETVQNAVEKVFGFRHDISGCSRTDSGVHALEYCAHIRGAAFIEPDKLPLALCRYLPGDIAVTSATIVDDTFHARYSATGKEYIYKIHNSHLHDPFYEYMAFRYPFHIDADMAGEVCKNFVGTKDFAAFMSSGSKITDTVRTVRYFEVRREDDIVVFRVAADGFLYNMVRIMVGTVLDVLAGRISADIGGIIKDGDRKKAGVTVPAHGLYLSKVFYETIKGNLS